jgi:hypothetical protein
MILMDAMDGFVQHGRITAANDRRLELLLCQHEELNKLLRQVVEFIH